MILVSLRQISLAFGQAPLLDSADLQVAKGDRIGLLGRNGAGKSSLLGLIQGRIAPDAGQIDRRQGLRITELPQDVPVGDRRTVLETVAGGAGPTGQNLLRFFELSRHADTGTEQELADLQQRIDASHGWDKLQLIEQIIDRLDLEAPQRMDQLSGGQRRRALLARALAGEPDILLLDEPTNHLDIASIDWLEQYLLTANLTLVFVTHDRAFLRRVANRIVELDRGKLYDYPGDYANYLRRQQERLHAEEEQQRRFDRKLSEEEAWIRNGIKARRTRNEGRVRALEQMRRQRQQRRERSGNVRLQLEEAEHSGKLVIEADSIRFGYGDRMLIENFSATILRGDRVGVIGPNGAGKTTLLKLLLGELEPQRGRVRHGTNLQVVTFDQQREQLDLDRTVQQNLSGDQDTVLVGDRPRHVFGYLKDFLFTPDRARTPVRYLSGGERARLLLARLFTRPANVLVLDEPTNDLDLETLDLLEEVLSDYQGTLFLVSHDREFLDRLVTSTIAFDPDGRVREYVGGYSDWLRQRPQPPAAEKKEKTGREKPKKERPRKLSFREKRELEELPARIEELETEQKEIHTRLADPGLYRSAPEQVAELKQRLDQVETELEAAFERWQELEAIEC